MASYNLNKRPYIQDDVPSARPDGTTGKPPKNPKGNNGNGNNDPEPPPPQSSTFVIYLDIDGHSTGASSYWGAHTYAPANLSSEQLVAILNEISNDWRDYNIVITFDEAIYNATPIGKKTRVVLTESWEWFGQAGGVAFRGSMLWTIQEEPCFVFTSLLHYNTKNIWEAASHEAAHTAGLHHQSIWGYDANNTWVKLNEYNFGANGWAPITGVGYYQPVTEFSPGGWNSIGVWTNEQEYLLKTLGPRQ